MKNTFTTIFLVSILAISVAFGQTTTSPGLGLPADFPFDLPAPQPDGPGVLPTAPTETPLPEFNNNFFDAPPLDSSFVDNGAIGVNSGEQLRTEAESLVERASRQRRQQRFPSLGSGIDNNYRLQQQLRDLSNFLQQQEQDESTNPAFNDQPKSWSPEEAPWVNP